MKRPLSIRGAILIWVLFCLPILGAEQAGGAEAKPALQAQWDKIVSAARSEGALTIYGNTGYDAIFAEFEKKYPGIKVVYVTGRGGPDIVPRILSEQRAEKYLGDLFLAGPTPAFTLHQGKALDPVKPALVLPEVADESKWWQGKHQYVDKEGAYIFTFNGTFRVDVVYNTNLVNAKEVTSYWDLSIPSGRERLSPSRR